MAAGATYEPIATQTLGSTTTTVTFSSIPSTYTELVLVLVGKVTSSGQNLYIRFNNDSNSSYSRTLLFGNGSAAGSNRNTSQTAILDFYVGLNVSGDSMHTINIMNYANTTTFKTMLWRNGRTGEATQAIVGLYRSTSAINRIDLSVLGLNIAIGSTFTLYGISAA
jgi:hypothetical protein